MRQSIGGESAKVYRLHPLEKALVVVSAMLLIFQPWAVGGMYLWTQYVAGALALLAFIIALIPRHYTDAHHAGKEMKLVMWPKLLRFPFFWLGVAYIIFVLLQIANPAWQYHRSDLGWWLQSVDYIKWLPHGIADTPTTIMNGWRTLLIEGAAWLMVCALWVGITRRKTIRILLTTFAINGVLIALVVLAQRLIGAKKLLWFHEVGPSYFAGSFIYKNHAGAFFILILAACLGLAWWHADHAERRLEKSNPATVFLFLSGLVATALMFTYGRATTALGGTLMLLVALAYALRVAFRPSGGPPKIVTAITALAGAGFIALCIASFNVDSVWNKFDRLFEQDKFNSVTSRQLATQATLDMARESLITGHGAGSFRFLFPLYQQNYPEIYHFRHWDKKKQEYVNHQRLYWEHAHDDYAEWLAENGIVGAVLVGIGLILIIGSMWQGRVLTQPALLILLGGPFFVAISAAVDFPMHNPAVLVGSCVITALALRWGALSRH